VLTTTFIISLPLCLRRCFFGAQVEVIPVPSFRYDGERDAYTWGFRLGCDGEVPAIIHDSHQIVRRLKKVMQSPNELEVRLRHAFWSIPKRFPQWDFMGQTRDLTCLNHLKNAMPATLAAAYLVFDLTVMLKSVDYPIDLVAYEYRRILYNLPLDTFEDSRDGILIGAGLIGEEYYEIAKELIYPEPIEVWE
jgi:hypothetical protein